MTLRFPQTQYPVGWFQVGRSHELESGAVHALQYFGEDLVLWRADSGRVYLQDAFCLHQGAHRGVKGWVNGEDIVCPFHGWQWDGDGRNVHIPQSKSETCKPNLQVRTYPVEEWCGNIMAWYAPDASAPTWPLPSIPEYHDPAFHRMHPYSDQKWRVRAHPQMPGENGIDISHTHFVHGTQDTPRLVQIKATDHVIRADVEVLYGGNRERTRLTPNGPVWGIIQQYQYGCGLAVVRWEEVPIPTMMIVGFTPVDDNHIDYFFQMNSRRDDGAPGDEPAGIAAEFLRLQTLVQTQDFFTWEHMKVLQPPNFTVDEEKGWEIYRTWATQFYPHDPTMHVA